MQHETKTVENDIHVFVSDDPDKQEWLREANAVQPPRPAVPRPPYDPVAAKEAVLTHRQLAQMRACWRALPL